MDLRKFGEKYPFLQGNLAFWENYLTAREAVMSLLPSLLDTQLEHSSFLANIDKNQPFFAYENIRIAADDIHRLADAFCRAMGLAPVQLSWPDNVPLYDDLTFTEDENGFVSASVHAAIASYVESVIAVDEEAINWLELNCPICGAAAAMGLIAPSGKKNLVCSHCHTVWIYMRTACGLCGHTEERGTVFYTADEEPNWIIEPCDACDHYLKVYDMRNSLPDVISYPLFYLTSWNLDLTMRDKEYEPAFFAIFAMAGWLKGH